MNVRRIKIVILVTSAMCFNKYCYAQNANRLGLGMTTGYRYDNSSLYAEYAFGERVVGSAEFTANKYAGNGIGVSGCYSFYPLKERKLAILAGVTFSRSFGTAYSIDWSEGGVDKTTFFDVNAANYIIPTIGVRYNIAGYAERETYKRKVGFSLIFRAGYRLIAGETPQVTYVSGAVAAKEQDKAIRAIAKGIGFSIGFAISIGRKEKQ
jgi:hypothetical protein